MIFLQAVPEKSKLIKIFNSVFNPPSQFFELQGHFVKRRYFWAIFSPFSPYAGPNIALTSQLCCSTALLCHISATVRNPCIGCAACAPQGLQCCANSSYQKLICANKCIQFSLLGCTSAPNWPWFSIGAPAKLII